MGFLSRTHKTALISTSALVLGTLIPQTASADDPLPPLLPQVQCKESICEIIFSGVFDGKTLTTEALNMKFSTEEVTQWQPRFQSTELLQIDGIDATYGWLIGENSEVEIYLTPLTDPRDDWSEPSGYGPFMIEQRAGFERVGFAYKFIALSYDRSRLVTALDLPPAIGPQRRVTSANIFGVRMKEQRYNPETGDFDPAYTQYEWYSGADSDMLGTVEDMDAINAETDRLSNVPDDE